MMKNERLDKKGYWDNELDSLGIIPKQSDEFSDKEELAELADNIKLTYYQEYKTAYDEKLKDYDLKFDRVI